MTGLTVADIYSNWQSNTYITGPVITDGLDLGLNSSYSMKYWTGNAWGNITDTKSSYTLFGNAGGTIADNKPFFIFLRGDRTIYPSPDTSMHSAVTISANGLLQTGNKYFTLTGLNYATAGNPYASLLDLDAFRRDNAGLKQTYYYWDPNLGSSTGSGQYVTATYANGVWVFTNQTAANITPRYLQSGQAFVVVPNGQTAVTFKETQKVRANSNNAVFGIDSTTGSIRVDMSKGAPMELIDGIVTLYNNMFNTAVLEGEDAYKFWGNEENIAIVRDSSYLSIEARPDININDTTFLFLNAMMVDSTYNFTIAGTYMPSTITGFLIDKFLNTQTVLDLQSVTNIPFTVTTDSGSAASDRFMIVYHNSNTLSVGGLQIIASSKDKSVLVEWKIITERNTDHYEVERSKDGIVFMKIATAISNNRNNSSYSYTGNEAMTGVNYYRIKVVKTDAVIQYSRVAKVTIGVNAEDFSIYPNPVSDREVNIMMTNIIAGNYVLTMYDVTGKIILAQNIHNTGGMTSTIHLPDYITPGIYELKLSDNKKVFTQKLIVQ